MMEYSEEYPFWTDGKGKIYTLPSEIDDFHLCNIIRYLHRRLQLNEGGRIVLHRECTPSYIEGQDILLDRISRLKGEARIRGLL